MQASHRPSRIKFEGTCEYCFTITFRIFSQPPLEAFRPASAPSSFLLSFSVQRIPSFPLPLSLLILRPHPSPFQCSCPSLPPLLRVLRDRNVSRLRVLVIVKTLIFPHHCFRVQCESKIERTLWVSRSLAPEHAEYIIAFHRIARKFETA